MSEALRHEMRKTGFNEALKTLDGLFATPMFVEPLGEAYGTQPWNWPQGVLKARVVRIYETEDRARILPMSVFLVVTDDGVFYDLVAAACRLVENS